MTPQEKKEYKSCTIQGLNERIKDLEEKVSQLEKKLSPRIVGETKYIIEVDESFLP